MAEFADQVFVLIKQWLLGIAPEQARPAISIILSFAPILMVFPLLFALTTVVERKLLGRIQNRYGPNRVGPWGLLQPVADGLKMLTKENIIPHAANRLVFLMAPVMLVVPVVLAFAVIPYGRNMAPIDLDAGLLFFFAVGAATELSVFIGGWASRNKYSLMGAMRAIAQMISYELPLILSTVTVVMMAGTLSTVGIVEAQAVYKGTLAQWHVFTPWGLAAFLLFLVAALAESNRTPFDLPEAESELVAGYFTEYSGFKFALFFLGEYLGLFAVAGLGVTLFLGGWTAPFSFLAWIPSWLWFFAKLAVLVFIFIWVRGTLPRLRTDQLMNLAWKFMLPMALINLVAAALWHFLGHGLAAWLACLAVIGIPYVLLGNALSGGAKGRLRNYRFAD